MREQREGSVSSDPDMCLWGGDSFDGKHVFCKLINAWTNCLEAGGFVTPDGGTGEMDNSPEACARRLRAMRSEADEEADG